MRSYGFLVVLLLLLLLFPKRAHGWMAPSMTTPYDSRRVSSSFTPRRIPPSPLFQSHKGVITMMGQRGKRMRREKRRALKEPTPPRIQTPYGPIRLAKPPRVCERCSGRGLVRCSVCEGRGAVRATGQRKTNSLQRRRLVGSRWTSVEIVNGHRHHTVMEVQGSPKKKGQYQVRMQNCCGVQQDFWIPVYQLKNKLVWRMGTLLALQSRSPCRSTWSLLLEEYASFFCASILRSFFSPFSVHRLADLGGHPARRRRSSAGRCPLLSVQGREDLAVRSLRRRGTNTQLRTAA
jgi:tryptophan-rich hypothetical protein